MRSPFSQGFGSAGGFAVNRGGGSAASVADAAGQAARIRYQAVGGSSAGGAVAASQPAAGVRLAGGTGGGAAVAASGQASSMGISFGIAAASPFVALLGKMIKDKSDDR